MDPTPKTSPKSIAPEENPLQAAIIDSVTVINYLYNQPIEKVQELPENYENQLLLFEIEEACRHARFYQNVELNFAVDLKTILTPGPGLIFTKNNWRKFSQIIQIICFMSKAKRHDIWRQHRLWIIDSGLEAVDNHVLTSVMKEFTMNNQRFRQVRFRSQVKEVEGRVTRNAFDLIDQLCASFEKHLIYSSGVGVVIPI